MQRAIEAGAAATAPTPSVPPRGPRALPALPRDPAADAKAAAVRDALGDAGSDAGLRWVDAGAFGGLHWQRWRLGNGLHIVLLPDSTSQLIAYHTWIGVGSAQERKGATGVAHLLEHLMFKGSEGVRAGVFDRALERMGSSPNAATWLDWTMYHQTIVPDGLAEVARMEADRLARLKVTRAGFASELEVVRAERREAVDNDPEGRLDEAFFRALFGAEVGYGHPTLGSRADLRGLDRDTALAFYRRCYAPAAVTLVLAGAVDAPVVLPILAASYGGLATGEGPPPRPVVPALTPLRKELRLDLGSERLLVGWRALPGDDRDGPALALLVDLLGNADSARLDRALVDDAKLASAVDVDALGFAATGAVMVRVTLRPGQVADAALARLDAELAALVGARPVLEAEVAAARNRIRVERYGQLAGVDGRADALGAAAATYGDPGVAEAWFRQLEAVTVADVRRVAALLAPSAPRVVLLARARAAAPALEPQR